MDKIGVGERLLSAAGVALSVWALVKGDILSAAGLALSVWALVKADSAMKAVDKVILKNNNQIMRDDARGLLDKLTGARDAAMGRKQGASGLSSAGRAISSDKRALELAQDALATATLGSDQLLTSRLRVAADELEKALVAINSPSGRDGWADALGVLQGVLPELKCCSGNSVRILFGRNYGNYGNTV